MKVEIETLTKEQEEAVMHRISEEVLEERLGIPATQENICGLVVHLVLFEKEVQQRKKARFKKPPRCAERC